MTTQKIISKRKIGDIKSAIKGIRENASPDTIEEKIQQLLELQATAQGVELEYLISEVSEAEKLDLGKIDKQHRFNLGEAVNNWLSLQNILLEKEVKDIDCVKFVTELKTRYSIVAIMHSHEFGLHNRHDVIGKRRDIFASFSLIWTPLTDIDGNLNTLHKMCVYCGGWIDSKKESITPELERSMQYFSNYIHSAKRNGYRIVSVACNILTENFDTFMKKVKVNKKKEKVKK